MPEPTAERRGWAVPVAAALVFAALALGATAVVEWSGQEVVDLALYRTYGERLAGGLLPYRDFRVEYPPGALPAFLLPALLTSGDDAYRWVFAASMALAGSLGVLLLAVALRRLGRPPALERWTLLLVALAPLALGGVVLTRFDLLPAAVTLAATMLLVAGRLRAGALVLGAAIAIKLYPLVLLPLLAAWAWRRGGRREAAAATALALGVAALAYLPFLVLAPDGVAESIGRQLGRPLQIESLGAGVLLALHHVAGMPLAWASSHGSQNLTGAAAGALAVLLTLSQIVVLGWAWARFARGPAEPERLVSYAATSLLAFVALGKVLSPQFLVWLLFAVPLVAGRRGVVAGRLSALAAVLTAIWFPALYWRLVREFDPLASSLVLARDVVLVGALVVLVRPLTARRRAPARSRTPAPSPGHT